MMPPTLELARSVMRFQGFVNVRTSAEPEEVSSSRTFRQFLDLALFIDWAESEGLAVLVGIPGLDGGAADGR